MTTGTSQTVAGRTHDTIVDLIRVGRLTSLTKPDGGVRGIVAGDVVRSLPTVGSRGGTGNEPLSIRHVDESRVRVHRPRSARTHRVGPPRNSDFGGWDQRFRHDLEVVSWRVSASSRLETQLCHSSVCSVDGNRSICGSLMMVRSTASLRAKGWSRAML